MEAPVPDTGLRGPEGPAADLPPIHKSHPQTTPPETVAKIRALALEHPFFGCNRYEAMLALEARHAEQASELTGEQAAFLEKLNPFSGDFVHRTKS